MEKREKIKLKIKALLEKTTENGATKEEALSAMQKAQLLMEEYYISAGDIASILEKESLKLIEVPLVKSGYDLGLFYNELVKLYDCHYYYNSYRICFYGFEQDAELCAYFYNFITKACLLEVDKYKASENYKDSSRFYHGRTLVSSFIKGFLLKIATRLSAMYLERKQARSQETGLIIYEKKNEVDRGFDLLDLNLTISAKKALKYEDKAFYDGSVKGGELNLVQGVGVSVTSALIG